MYHEALNSFDQIAGYVALPGRSEARWRWLEENAQGRWYASYEALDTSHGVMPIVCPFTLFFFELQEDLVLFRLKFK